MMRGNRFAANPSAKTKAMLRSAGQDLGRTYGGRAHSAETLAKMRAASARRWADPSERAKAGAKNRGRVLTAEHKAKISAGVHTVIANCDGNCNHAACGKATSPTRIEDALYALLSEFPTVEREVKFGPYRVDAYLPEYRLAFEADGDYWHRDRDDATRDAWIIEHTQVEAVVRLEEGLLA